MLLFLLLNKNTKTFICCFHKQFCDTLRQYNNLTIRYNLNRGNNTESQAFHASNSMIVGMEIDATHTSQQQGSDFVYLMQRQTTLHSRHLKKWTHKPV